MNSLILPMINSRRGRICPGRGVHGRPYVRSKIAPEADRAIDRDSEGLIYMAQKHSALEDHGPYACASRSPKFERLLIKKYAVRAQADAEIREGAVSTQVM